MLDFLPYGKGWVEATYKESFKKGSGLNEELHFFKGACEKNMFNLAGSLPVSEHL